MSFTAIRARIKKDIPDLGPDTVARRRLRDLERGADAVETATDVINTIGSLNPVLASSIDLDPTVNESLTQIGDSPFYWQGNEPVDPRNCDLWPNSPYCGGQIVDPLDVREVGATLKVTVTLCETCIQVDPKFLGISGPSGIVCWRNDLPECNPVGPPPPEDAESPPKPNERKEFYYPAETRANEHKVIRTWNFIQNFPVEGPENNYETELAYWNEKEFTIQVGNILSEFSYPAWTFQNFDRSYQSSQTLGNLTGANPDGETVYFRFGNFSTDQYYVQAGTRGWVAGGVPSRAITIVEFGYGDCADNLSEFRIEQDRINRNPYTWLYRYLEDLLFQQFIPHTQAFRDSKWGAWADLGSSSQTHVALMWADPSKADSNGDFDVSRGYFSFSGSPIHNVAQSCNYAPPPANQPLPGKDMGCCDETLELLEAIYTRLGVDEFPVKAPALLVQENEAESTLENHAQLWEWQARNLDALMGQFPIKIKVKDSDPTTEGNQEVEIKLPNVAETLAELFGLVYQAETNGDLLVEMLLRLIPEVLSTKNAALIGQSYSKANSSALGYKINSKEVEVDYNFDLEESQSLPRFLRESKKRLTVPQDDSRESIIDIMAKLEFAAGIIKSAFYVAPSETGRLLESIETMIGDEALSIPNKEKWRDWLQRMNRDLGKHNAGQSIQPEIIEDFHEGLDKL